MERKRRVTVVGGRDVGPAVLKEAEELGRRIGAAGWVLVNGGRDAGVMAASARGAHGVGGLVIGILPGVDEAGVSEHVDVPVLTGLGEARNVVNVLTGEVVVALAGGAGTLSEVALALKSGRPVVLVGWQGVNGLERWGLRGRLTQAGDVDEAIEAVQRYLSD